MNKKRIILPIIGTLLFLFIFSFPLQASAAEKTAEKIYFFNVDGSDMTLIESNGHYGLIDSSNPSYQMFGTDKSLFNTKYNGKTIAEYMKNVLKITHLDFVIGTHAHSDHIGGMSEIAKTGLIDKNTVYIYKKYVTFSNVNRGSLKNINDYQREDAAWHNGDFAQKAVESMSNAGAKICDVSSNDYSGITNAGYLKNVLFEKRTTNDTFDDRVSFNFGDYKITLYNLYPIKNNVSENTNSILVLTQKKDKNILLLGDIDDSQYVASNLAKIIKKDINNGRINILKNGHHGSPYGSNTKVEADAYKPEISIRSRGTTEIIGCYANFKYYCENNFGTVSYVTGKAEKAIVAKIPNTGDITIKQLKTDGSLTNMPKDTGKVPDGFHLWDSGRAYAYDDTTVGKTMYYYYKDGVLQYSTSTLKKGWQYINGMWFYETQNNDFVEGWREINGRKYYFLNPCRADYTRNVFSGKAQMQTGWQKVNGDWYYLQKTQTSKYKEGEMRTGWLKLGDKWYLLSDTGKMLTGWQKKNGKWYYLQKTSNENHEKGEMRKGWIKVDGKWYYLQKTQTNEYKEGEMRIGWIKDEGKWYYLKSSGAMATGWIKDNGKWYYLNSSGAMATGWLKDDGKWYYLNSSGAMVTGWQTIDGKQYYFYSNGALK